MTNLILNIFDFISVERKKQPNAYDLTVEKAVVLSLFMPRCPLGIDIYVYEELSRNQWWS